MEYHEDIIEKVKFLQSKVNYSNNNYIQNTSDNSLSRWDMQLTAKFFLRHINLDAYCAIVTILDQKANIAGHIELNHNDEKDIFIEIDTEIATRSSQFKTTLAHEISHKHLAVNNIRLKDDKENERLTDINTVLLGFGNIMIEGCEYIEDIKYTYDKSATKTVKIGYLSKDELIFVKAIFDNITPSNYKVSKFKFRLLELIINNLYKKILPYIENSKKTFLDKNIQLINISHSSLCSFFEIKKTKDISNKTIQDIKLWYIYEKMKSIYIKLLFKFLLKKISSFNFSPTKKIYRKIVRCPICKNKYQNFPYDKKLIKIKCANRNCEYDFFITTTSIKN